jgi:hypothetical protein
MTLPAAIEGPAPDGSPVRVDLSGGRHVIHFLTSSCKPCRAVWPALGSGDVAVTPSASTESRRKVASLAPLGVTVVMSSDVWFAFAPGPAPWRVVVEEGEVVESVSGQAGP